MKTFSKKLILPLFALCLFMGKANAQGTGTNTGIWDTYILFGSSPATFFVDGSHLQIPDAIPFSELDLGRYSPGGTLTLAGGLDFTAKVTAHANVCGGKLFYSVYPASGSPTTWDSIALGYTGSYGNVVVDSVTNQEWSTTNNATNILTGLTDGSYKIQVYFTSTGSTSSTGNCDEVFTENNGGANYTAFFAVSSNPLSFGGAGIYDTYVSIGNTNYFVDGIHLEHALAPAFNGANLGTFTHADSLKLTGAEDYTYKNSTSGNVCGGNLHFSIYPSGQAAGDFSNLPLGYTGSFGNVTLDSLTLQEWSGSIPTPLALAPFPAGTYNVQAYFSSPGSDTAGNACNKTFVQTNGGANYTATFTIIGGLGAKNITNSNAWITYPSPFTSQLNISTANMAKADKVELFDVLGRTVFTATDVTANPMQLNLTGINAGTYYVRITTGDGSFVKAVVKE